MRESDIANTLKFFETLDFNLIIEPKPPNFSDYTSVDSVYRVFHHSFKMYYRFQDMANESLGEMFKLLGITNIKDYSSLLEEWGEGVCRPCWEWFVYGEIYLFYSLDRTYFFIQSYE